MAESTGISNNRGGSNAQCSQTGERARHPGVQTVLIGTANEARNEADQRSRFPWVLLKRTCCPTSLSIQELLKVHNSSSSVASVPQLGTLLLVRSTFRICPCGISNYPVTKCLAIFYNTYSLLSLKEHTH